MTFTRTIALSTFTLMLTSLAGCFLFNGANTDGSDEFSETEERSDDSAPVFLDFSVNTSTATDIDQITFTAVLTDPDGIEDLIGGTLKSPRGLSCGAFQTSAAKGAYELSLNWSDLNTVEVIELDLTNKRTVVAEFFDASGNTSSREIDVSLECEEDEETACGDGLCVPLTTVDNWSACGHDGNDDLPLRG
jgi:hypothetical protein